MDAKEKAKKLVDRMLQSMMPHQFDKDDAKQCALIAVDEMMKNEIRMQEYTGQVFLQYELEEIKEEITKL